MKLLALVICILSVAPPVWAQEYAADSTARDFVFYMPRGWNRVERPDATLLVAPVTAPSVAYIVLLPPADLAPDLRGAFNKQWEGFQKDYRVMRGGEVAPVRSIKGFESLGTGAVLADRQNHLWVFFLLVSQNGKHAETLFYMSNVGDSDLAKTLQEVFQHVVDSLGFSGGAGDPRVAEAAKPVAVPRGHGQLNGIYRGIGVVRYISGIPHPGWVYHTLFADGRFKEGFPDEGMDNLDEDAEIRRNPVGWGNYQLGGGPDGHGKIVFPPDGEYVKEPIVWDIKAYSPDEITIRGDSFKRLEPCDGLKLEGTFRREGYQQLFAGAQQGITFTPDGHFVDEGVLKAAGVMVRKPVGVGYDFDEGEPGSGTYRIANYTLELKYSNGRTKRTSFFREPGAPKENVTEFFLNTYKFIRVQ